MPLEHIDAPAARAEEELLALDEALRQFAVAAPLKAKLVELRYFGGLTVDETTEVMGLSAKTIKREWAAARAWLHGELCQSAS